MAKQIEAIRSEAEYEAALDEIEKFFEAEPAPGSADAARFQELLAAVSSYEREHCPVDPADTADGDNAHKRAVPRRARSH